MTNLNTSELRKINKRNVLRFVLKMKSTTKPELAFALGLSIPTVGQLTEELIFDGLLQAAGTKASSGGRRALCLEPVNGARHAVGIDITTQHINFVVVNLAGEQVAFERIRKRFEDKPEFYEFLVDYRRSFCARCGISEESIIGVGVSVQGLVSADQKYFASHMVEGRRMTPLYQYESEHPYFFLNDGTASCMAECYDDNTPDDFVYIMLSRTVGGAIVHGGKILEGTNMHAGEFGHMVVHPDRHDVCYCGRTGHMWCYSSVDKLSEFADGTYQQFFERLAAGDERYKERFDEYLDDLALAVNNIRASNDCSVIIGGYICAYFEPYMQYLKSKVAELDHMYAESKADILLGRYAVDAAATGAARYFVKKFIDELQ